VADCGVTLAAMRGKIGLGSLKEIVKYTKAVLAYSYGQDAFIVLTGPMRGVKNF